MDWKKKFFTIAVGQAISLIGSSAVQFSLIWWIASETDSALMLGLSGLVAFLPNILFSPLAGVAADRYSRKAICITADLSIGLVAAVFAIILWMYDMPVWTAILVLFFRSVGQTFHQPSLQAMLPQLVPAEYLVKANGWSQMMASGSFILGPVLGAALYAGFPLSAVLLTDLLGAVAASGLMGVVSVPKVPAEGHGKRRFLTELKEGLEVYQEDRKLFLFVVADTAVLVFFLPLSSFYPLMTSSYFNATAWHASAVEGAFAVGMLVSALLFGSVIQVRDHFGVSYLGLLGIGLMSAVSGMLPPDRWAWWVFMVACGLMGGFGNMYSIPIMAYMQEQIAPERMGRAFALLSLVGSCAMPLGLLIGSPIAEKTGIHTWFLLTGIAILAITAVAMAWNRRL